MTGTEFGPEATKWIEDLLASLAATADIPPEHRAQLETAIDKLADHELLELTRRVMGSQKTIRQHYVCQVYLKAWTTGKQLYCLFRDGAKVRPVPTTKIGVEKSFYRLREMTPEHIVLLKDMFMKDAGVKPEFHNTTLWQFTHVFGFRHLFNSRARLTPELDQLFDVWIQNVEEDIHSAMESNAAPILARLRGGDAECLRNPETYTMFTWFLGMQWMRTPGAKSLISSMVRSYSSTLDPEPAIGVMRHILALEIGAALFRARNTSAVVLGLAPNGVGFVTSDNPVVRLNREAHINIHGVRHVLYYPLSPSIALFIDTEAPSPEFASKRISADDVKWLNGVMVINSTKQVYGADELHLRQLLDSAS